MTPARDAPVPVDTAAPPQPRRARVARFSISLAVSELLQKRWTEAAFPFAMMVLVIIAAAVMIDGYLSPANLTRTGREFAEFGFVAIAMSLVLMSGGIDLSVGAVFALSNMLALLLIALAGWPVWAVIPTVLAFGAAVGAWNGLLVGYVKTRPFITTLTTLIIGRAVVNLLDQRYSGDLAASFIESDAWEFVGGGSVLGVPANVALLALVGVLLHIGLSRSRPGAHLMATGGDRRAAIHAGIDIRRVLFGTYVLSGLLAATAGVLYAARLDSGSANAGRGMEVMALAAAVLGGVSLAGGRGSIARALIGATIILVLINALVRSGVGGSAQSVWLGLVVLAAVAADVRWAKNRGRTLASLYVSPGRIDLPPRPLPQRPSPGAAPDPWAVNDALRDSIPHGEGETLAPGGVAFDADGRMVIGTGEGWILRYSPESHFRAKDYWLRPGGWPMGLQYNAVGHLVMGIAGRGLFSAAPDGSVRELTTQTNRSWTSIRDDSRIRVPCDLEICADGRIFLAEGTTRHDAQGWTTDAMEGRGNGSLIVHDPASGRTKTLVRGIAFCGGVCVTHDGSALLVSATWEAAIYRYPLRGPQAGQLVPFMTDLPAYPAAIHRASGGGYWVAFPAVRSPAYNLAMRIPAMRTRMVRRLPPDEWMMPNFNVGLAARLAEDGRVTQTLWDPLGRNHAMLTSVREHRGHLYLVSMGANKIGRKALASADPTWVDTIPGSPST